MPATAPTSQPPPRDGDVGLAHDYLLVMRGAERTFAEIARCFPGAPVFTTLYSEQGTEGRFASRVVVSSPLQRLNPGQGNFRRLLPLYPWAVGKLPTARFPLVVSSSSAFAIGVPRAEDAVHVCYCHTPFRYAWHERDRALSECPRPLRPGLRALLARHRRWERRAADRVSLFIANSRVTRERIADLFERDSEILHPPVEIDRFSPGTPGEHFLIVSELVPHKRVELALQAARRAAASVRVVGGGPELERLKAAYGDVADFLGRVDDERLAVEYAAARAVLVTAPEEFGIVAVEGQAAGRPVLAFDAGGARETVIAGLTGELVPDGDPTALAEAMGEIDFERFSPEAARENARRFSVEAFAVRLRELVGDAARAGG